MTQVLGRVYTLYMMEESRKKLVAVAKDAYQNCECFKARQKARELTRVYDDALRPVKLRVTQFTMLCAILERNGESNISELAQVLGMERTTFSRNLGPLVRREMVKYTEDKPGRDRSVIITDKGLSIFSSAVPLWRKVDKKYRG